jgi:predicted component of type VI protein secretion system
MEQTIEGPCMSVEAQLVASVWLRMIRGSSDQPLFMLSCALGEQVVSVGASEHCDWRILGEHIPELALELRVMANCLFARAIGAADVFVDGEQLAAMWVPIEKGARLQVGSAMIEVGLSGRSRAAQTQALSASLGAQAALDEAADSLLARFSVTGLSSPDSSGALCDSTCAATVLDPEASERVSQPWRSTGVLIAGSLMACAYGCWVLLLDYF